MTSETSIREKGRAVFLAAIMVLSVVAMSAAMAGGAAAVAPDGPEDDGPTYDADNTEQFEDAWIGQEITLVDDAEFGANADELQIYEGSEGDGDRVLTERIRGDEVTIDTAELEEQSYQINIVGEGDSNWDNHTFWGESDEFEASFTGTATTDGDTTLEFDSDRSNQWVGVATEDLDADEVESLFTTDDDNVSDTAVYEDDDEEYAAIELTGENFADDPQEVTFDFSDVDVDAGEHEFEFFVTDTGSSDTATLEVTDEDADWNFGDVTDVNQGEVAEIEIDVDHSEEAVVMVSDDSDEVYWTVELTDIDDEDDVVLEFNTHAPNSNISEEFEEGWNVQDDNASIADVHNSGHGAEGLPAYTWDLSIGNALETDENNDPIPNEFQIESDVSALMVGDAAVDASAQTHTAPAGDALDEHEDYEDTTVTATDTIAEDDHLIVTIDEYGLEGQIAEFIADEGTDDIGADLYTELGIEVSISEPEAGPFPDPATWNASDGDLTVNLLNENLDTYDGDLILEIEDIDESEDEIEFEQTYDASVSITEENNDYIDDEDDEIEQSLELEFVDREFDFDDIDSLPATEDATASGTTTVAPGTTFSGQASSPGDEGGFVTGGEGEVTEGDDLHVVDIEYDLAGQDEGVLFSITGEDSYDSDNNDELEDLTIGDAPEEDDDLELDVDYDETITVGDSTDVDATVTNNLDATTTVDVTLELDGEEWSEELEIDAGEDATATFEDLGAELDEGDYDLDVTASSDDVDEDATYSGTLTVDAEDDDDDDDDDDADDDDDDDDDDDGTPGFGIAVAIAALIGAAMLALRRQD